MDQSKCCLGQTINMKVAFSVSPHKTLQPSNRISRWHRYSPVSRLLSNSSSSSSSSNQVPCSISRRRLLRFCLSVPISTLILPSSSHSASYDDFAPNYEMLDGSTILTRFLGFDQLRSSLLSYARGAVIELGAGTGVNLPYYPVSSIHSFTAVDQSPAMLQRLSQRSLTITAYPINTVISDALQTPFESHSFDTVVATFCLCVVSDPHKLASEIRRLVAPGGMALVLDYTRSEFSPLAAYQDITASTVRGMSKGCVPNLDLPQILSDAGFIISSTSSVLAGTVLALQLEPIDSMVQ